MTTRTLLAALAALVLVSAPATARGSSGGGSHGHYRHHGRYGTGNGRCLRSIRQPIPSALPQPDC